MATTGINKPTDPHGSYFEFVDDSDVVVGIRSNLPSTVLHTSRTVTQNQAKALALKFFLEQPFIIIRYCIETVGYNL